MGNFSCGHLLTTLRQFCIWHKIHVLQSLISTRSPLIVKIYRNTTIKQPIKPLYELLQPRPIESSEQI